MSKRERVSALAGIGILAGADRKLVQKSDAAILRSLKLLRMPVYPEDRLPPI